MQSKSLIGTKWSLMMQKNPNLAKETIRFQLIFMFTQFIDLYNGTTAGKFNIIMNIQLIRKLELFFGVK